MSGPDKLLPITIAKAFGWEFEPGKQGHVQGNVRAYDPLLQCTRCRDNDKEYCEYGVYPAGTGGSSWGLPPTDKVRTRGQCVQCKSEITRASGCSIVKDGWVLKEPSGIRFLSHGRLSSRLSGTQDASDSPLAPSAQGVYAELGAGSEESTIPASRRPAAPEAEPVQKKSRVRQSSSVWPGRRLTLPAANGKPTGEPSGSGATPSDAADQAKGEQPSATKSEVPTTRADTASRDPPHNSASAAFLPSTPISAAAPTGNRAFVPPSSPHTVSSTQSVDKDSGPAVVDETTVPAEDVVISHELARMHERLAPGQSMREIMTAFIAIASALENASQDNRRQTLAAELALDTLDKEREERRHVEDQLREDNRAAEKRAETATKDAAAAREEAEEARASLARWKAIHQRS